MGNLFRSWIVKDLRILFLLIPLLSAGRAEAQITSGSVSGTVVDPTKAAVQGAQVTLTDANTNTPRNTKTDAQGEFTFPQVAPGTYKVTITASSFATYTEAGIDLHANQSYKIDATLGVASAKSENVTIQASDLTVNTESSEVSSLIDSEEVEQVPLNGRDFLQLLTLIPGSAPADSGNLTLTGLTATVNFSLSGGSDDAAVYTIDGAQMRDPGGNDVIPVFISIDAIDEVRVQTNSYGPQYGGGGGSQVNILTKSGTNKFHGTAYNYFRNDDLNANEISLKQANQPRGKLRYNDFGYTVGGPVLKQKVFFFFSEEFRRQEFGITNNNVVPTDQERVGDFTTDAARYNSNNCYGATPANGKVTTAGGCGTYPIDPYTGEPLGYAGPGQPLNVSSAKIPASEYDASGQAFLALYPSPNTPDPFANQNFVATVNAPVNTREESGRLDYKLNDSIALLVRYTHDNWVNGPGAYYTQLWGEDGFPKVSDTWTSPSDNLAVRLTRIHGASVNTVGFSRTTGYTSIGAGNGATVEAAAVAAIPTFFQKTGTQPHALYWGDAGTPTLWTNQGFYNDYATNNISDDYSKVIGKHTLVAGGIYTRGSKNDVFGGSGLGQVPTFGGAQGFRDDPSKVTHNAVANFLFEGITYDFSENDQAPHNPARFNNYELYAGDTYKVLPNLTINYGFRWSFLRQPYSADDKIANFYPGAWTATNASSPLDGLITPSSGGFGRATVANQNDNIAPRVGVSWDVFGTGKTVVRSGFGEFFQTTQSSGQFLNLSGNPPFVHALSGIRYLDTASGFTYGGGPLSPSQAGVGYPTNGIDPNLQTPATFQWNLIAAQEITPKHIVQAAYVANRGLHNYIKSNINQVAPQDRLACVVATYNSTSNNHSCANFTPFGAGVIGQNGITYVTWAGDSIYHSLQLSYQGRFGKRTAINAYYTWSRIIGDTGLTDIGASPTITDTYNPGYDRGPLSFNRTHIFTTNAVFTLPEFKGHGALIHEALGGWQLADISSVDSGLPLSISALATGTQDPTGIGNMRADLVPGQSVKGPKSRTEWFNTSAFTVNGHVIGTLGTSGRGIVNAPMLVSDDLSLHKDFFLPFLKSSYTADSSNLQFRADAFNFLNLDLPVGIDTGLGATNIDLSHASATNNKVSWNRANSNQDFGHVTGYRGVRQLQLSLKLTF